MEGFVSYIRVSTQRQAKGGKHQEQGNGETGRPPEEGEKVVLGLGQEAQRDEVRRYAEERGWQQIAELVEVESGRRNHRPKLKEALELCRRQKARLVIAKMDRLSRDSLFLKQLLRESVEVRFCDLPQVDGPTGRFLLGIMAEVAELEAGLISQRTKAALQAARERGTKLGVHSHKKGDYRAALAKARLVKDPTPPAPAVIELMWQLRDEGKSYREIAGKLNALGLLTPKRSIWYAGTTRKAMFRFAATVQQAAA